MECISLFDSCLIWIIRPIGEEVSGKRIMLSLTNGAVWVCQRWMQGSLLVCRWTTCELHSVEGGMTSTIQILLKSLAIVVFWYSLHITHYDIHASIVIIRFFSCIKKQVASTTTSARQSDFGDVCADVPVHY